MLTKDDIKGVAAMVPTPCKENGEGWDVTDSVNLDETARMTENYIRDGIGVIAACGTTGECAALLWEEKRAFVDAIVQINRKRVPVFAGATALGTKETIQQMRGLKDVGADGAFVGLPLWQTPTIENAVQFYADLGEAVPDMPILVYANARVFKSDFPTAFWERLAHKARTVIVTKMFYSHANLLDDLRVAGRQINFMPGESAIYAAYRMARPRITAIWSSGMTCMGPEPVVALANAILLVTFAERSRMAGAAPADSAVEGAESRLRPILMTSLAMIAGMVPMALALGTGAEVTAPLGRAVIGGLAAATLVNLSVLPFIFAILQARASTQSPSLDPDDPESRYAKSL